MTAVANPPPVTTDYRRPARRRTELGLIILAVILTGGLYALAGEGKAGSLPANIGPFLGVIFLLLVLGHLALRKWAPDADPILFPVAGLLNGIGYVFIARLSSGEAAAQAVWSAIGMVAFVATLIFVKRARDLERYRYTFGFIGIGLLLLPLVPHFGEDINGARLWVHVGSHEFQPGELAKLALAVFFASAVLVDRAQQLSQGTKRLGRMLIIDPKYLAPIVGAWALSMMIFLAENDLGSAFLFFALFVGMLWVATNRAFYLALGGALFIGGSTFALKFIGHAKSRVQSWLHPWADPSGYGYQPLHGWFAIANGGLFGTGPGQSNATIIPEASSDMIFAVIAEEIGLVGASALLLAYLLMVGTGLRIAVRSDHPFEKLLAVGLSLIIGVQTFVIVGGVTRLIPLTGITLPFVAYGGSSLISNYILLALLLRISDSANRETTPVPPRRGGGMNRPIRWVGLGVMALFVVLFVQLNYLQVVHASALQHNTLNNEQIVKEYNLPRGSIVSSDGVTLADSVKAPSSSDFAFIRKYPTGSLFGQITGYYSFIYGSSGVESTYNDVLVGTKHSFDFPSTFSLSQISKYLLNSSTAENVTLTLSEKLQQEAKTELAGRDGSIVALDPSTGAILAMYSNPTYDPAGLSQLSTTKETKTWDRLLAASGNPLSAGAYSNRWFPGSSFKVITSSAVYDHDPTLATKVYPTVGSIPLPDTTSTLHNFGYESCGGSLPELFTVSCDTGFAEVGLNLGAQTLESEAKAFGFDENVPLDLPDAAQSYFPPASSFAQNLPTLAYSAIGQENVSATPLEMAMVAGAIADKGSIMTPHVFEKATNNQDQVVSTYKPKLWRQATSAATASQLTTMMESVVNSANGTGTAAAIPGVEVAGKTGTAQTQVGGQPRTDDWMIAFAPASKPTIAVAVLIPDQSSADDYQGGTIAAPLAKAMIETYLSMHPSSASTSTTTTTTLPSTSSTVTTPTTFSPTPTTVATPPTTTAPTTPTTVATTTPATTPTTTKTTTSTAKGG